MISYGLLLLSPVIETLRDVTGRFPRSDFRRKTEASVIQFNSVYYMTNLPHGALQSVQLKEQAVLWVTENKSAVIEIKKIHKAWRVNVIS